jgi:hypothetical protein
MDRLTLKVQEALQAAQALAREHSHQALEPLHLLAALLDQEDGVVDPVLQKLGVSPQTLSGRVRSELERMPKVYGADAGSHLGGRLQQVLENVRAMVDQVRRRDLRCEIAIKYLIHPSNSDQILAACELARDLGVAHFHARPAASENIEGLGERLDFPMEEINQQLDACLALQTPTFKTFGVRHKFTRTFNLEHGFSRCLAAPLAIQCGADGRVYLCIDWRGSPRHVLGMHWPEPEQILEFWGSPAHIEKLRAVQVEKCPRCTYGIYARQIENTLERDAMCLNFP